MFTHSIWCHAFKLIEIICHMNSHILIKYNNFQTDLFNTDGTLASITTPSQNVTESNNNEGVLHTLQLIKFPQMVSQNIRIDRKS